MNPSPREREILSCALRGLSCKETARELSITSNTVRTHRRNVMKKLGTSRIVVAVLSARAKGLI